MPEHPCPSAHGGRAPAAVFLLVILAIASGLVLSIPSLGWGQEAVYGDLPTPASVEEVVTPMERSFREREPRPGLLPRFREELKNEDPFFRDTELDIKFRTVYSNRHRAEGRLSEAWATGGALSYESGWFLDRLSVGAVLYSSQPLLAPKDRDGTDLLRPGQEGFTVLGQLYARVRLFEGHFLHIYQHEYETPYLNRNDGFVIPHTFEGYAFNGVFGGKNGAPGLRYGGGYITKIKENNAERWDWMSEDAGVSAKRGVGMAGALFTWGKFALGAIDYHCHDVINIGYAEAKYSLSLSDRVGLLLSTQFTDQRSTGRDLLKGEYFSTRQFGVKADLGYGGAILTLAYTANASSGELHSPWGGYPGYTGSLITDFNGPGENAFLTKLSFDFARIGLPGVSAYALFAHGWGRVDPSSKALLGNVNEFNADLQWRPRWDPLKGFRARLRYGLTEGYGGSRGSSHEFRLTLNYDIPLL